MKQRQDIDYSNMDSVLEAVRDMEVEATLHRIRGCISDAKGIGTPAQSQAPGTMARAKSPELQSACDRAWDALRRGVSILQRFGDRLPESTRKELVESLRELMQTMVAAGC